MQKGNVSWSNLYVESKLANLIEAENKMVVPRGLGKKIDDVGQKFQFYKISKLYKSAVGTRELNSALCRWPRGMGWWGEREAETDTTFLSNSSIK